MADDTPTPPAAVPGAGTAPNTPLDQELAKAVEAQNQAKKTQTDALGVSAQAASDLKQVTDKIAALKANQTLLQGVLTDYGKSYGAWTDAKAQAQEASDAAGPVAEAGLGTKISAQLKALRDKQNKDIKAAADDVTKRQKALDGAQKAFDAATAAAAKDKAAIDDKKLAPKRLDAQLKALGALAAELATLSDKAQYAAMQLCKQELDEQLAASPVDATQLEADLQQTMLDAVRDSDDLATKKRTLDDCTQALAAAKKTLDDLGKNARTAVLAELAKVTAP